MLKVNQKSGEIFLYGIIGPPEQEADISEMDVIEALDSLDGKRVTVRINSPGGSVDHGISIYNALKRYEGGVDTVNDSLAASIASVIAMAGDKRATAEGARWMIHRARGGIVGTATQIRQYLERIGSYDESIVQIYAGALGKEVGDIGAMLDAETWFTSQSAVTAGLATETTSKTNAKPRIAAWFEHPPADLIAACAETVIAPYPVSRQAALIRSRI